MGVVVVMVATSYRPREGRADGRGAESGGDRRQVGAIMVIVVVATSHGACEGRRRERWQDGRVARQERWRTASRGNCGGWSLMSSPCHTAWWRWAACRGDHGGWSLMSSPRHTAWWRWAARRGDHIGGALSWPRHMAQRTGKDGRGRRKGQDSGEGKRGPGQRGRHHRGGRGCLPVEMNSDQGQSRRSGAITAIGGDRGGGSLSSWPHHMAWGRWMVREGDRGGITGRWSLLVTGGGDGDHWRLCTCSPCSTVPSTPRRCCQGHPKVEIPKITFFHYWWDCSWAAAAMVDALDANY
ncbi:hypothetical protein BJ912DRAFT_934193 [Pholiota molesta]|nr:hypothetical protein BJ912DRAFT_934193 [Pholiota molesta]